MSQNSPKPVTLITGFLGAGKTTFLNALIRFQQGKRLAIIENEFGEEGLDGDFIIGAGEHIFELSNGCLCCSLSEDFHTLLEELWQRRSEYDELVIETTGIADPASVASPFMTSRSMPDYYSLQRVICLVDAGHIEGHLKEREEVRQQLSFSDILLITKTDMVSAEYLPYLENLLEEINPFAKVLMGSKDEFPFDEILNIERQEIVQKRPKFSLAPVGLKAHRHDNLVSLSFTFEEPFSITMLQHQLMAFLLFQAKDVYRVKGIIYAAGDDKKIIVQSVNVNLVVEYGEPWSKEEPRLSRIVFIGKNLQPAGFERILRQSLSVRP